MQFKKICAAAAVAVASCAAANAVASNITYDIRGINNYSFSGSDYKAGWNLQSSPVSSTALNNFDYVAGGMYSFQHTAFNFNVGAPVSVIFQFGLDGGFGAEVRTDATVNQRDSYDVWWAMDWNNAPQILSTGDLSLASGNHTVEAYWAENCCAGPESARMSVDHGRTWESVSLANLDALNANAVPEPGMLALLGIGFAGFAARRRSRAR